MQQVKIFKGVEAEIHQLEKDVNVWIRDSRARILSLTGNIAPQSTSRTSDSGTRQFAPSDVLLIVLYEAPGE